MKNVHRSDQVNNRYIWYYVSGLVCNSAILSFYSVQAFTESPECLATDGKNLNITRWFDLAFICGFGLHLTKFLFFAFVDPQIRRFKID